jgi:hypothetical protein
MVAPSGSAALAGGVGIRNAEKKKKRRRRRHFGIKPESGFRVWKHAADIVAFGCILD